MHTMILCRACLCQVLSCCRSFPVVVDHPLDVARDDVNSGERKDVLARCLTVQAVATGAFHNVAEGPEGIALSADLVTYGTASSEWARRRL